MKSIFSVLIVSLSLLSSLTLAAPQVVVENGKIKGISNAVEKSPLQGRSSVAEAQLDVCLDRNTVDFLKTLPSIQGQKECKSLPLSSLSCSDGLRDLLCEQMIPCLDSEHINGKNGCEPNVVTCEVENGIGEQLWGDAEYGLCMVISCNTNFVMENNSCVPAIAQAPPALNKITSWLRADNLSSLNQGLIEDGQEVSSWDNFILPSSAPRGPKYLASGPKNRPTLDFRNQGGLKISPAATFNNTGNFTLSVVYSATPGVSGWDVAVGSYPFVIGVAYGAGYYAYQDGWAYYSYGGLKPVEEYVLVTVVADVGAGTLKVYREGVLVATQSYPNSSYPFTLASLANLSLGNIGVWGTGPLNGYLPEMIFYDSALSAGEVGVLNEYLMYKYIH